MWGADADRHWGMSDFPFLTCFDEFGEKMSLWKISLSPALICIVVYSSPEKELDMLGILLDMATFKSVLNKHFVLSSLR